MMKNTSDVWTDEERDNIISELKNYLQLYLFKGNVSAYNGPLELFNLNDEDLFTLKSLHLLLSDEIKQLTYILPFLLRNLAHSTLKEKITYKGIIKGKIDWISTFKERFSQGYNDKSLFVCTPPSKSYDLDENQLLKFLLKKIIFLYENSLKFIDEENYKESWHESVVSRYFNCRKALKNVYFNEISDIDNIKPKTLKKAINHRNYYYKIVAKSYKLYEDLFIFNDLDKLKFLIENQLLNPNKDDELYELYVFFKLVDSLEDIQEISLLMPNNDYSVLARKYDCKIKIYYQAIPKSFTSKYKEIFSNYNISVNFRRPDIIIEFEKNGILSYRIIEVKRTSDEKYIRDSVYKVLGYLYDFEDVNFTSKIPGVLVCWDGIKIIDKLNVFNQKVLILNNKSFLKKILFYF